MNFIRSNNTYTVIIENAVHSFSAEHPEFTRLVECLKTGDCYNFLQLIDKKPVYEEWLQEPLDSVPQELYDRMEELKREGFDSGSLKRFIDNLSQNPSRNSVQQLFGFLENKHLPITDDGCFLAYKGVTDDYKDCYTLSNDNRVGCKVSMPRNQVCDDASKGCSTGLHVGSMEYATSFGKRTVIVKVNPKDVVSVPRHEEQKCRVCYYEVVGEYKGAMPNTYSDEYDPDIEEDYEDCCPECGDEYCKGDCE